MNQTQLLQGESVVMASTDDSLILTNLRVRYEAKNGGTDAYKSIPLPKVSACAVTTRKYPILLLLSALCVLAVIGSSTEGARFAAALGAVGFGAAYFLTRNGQLEVVSDAGFSIAVPTKGLKHEEVRRFSEAIACEISKCSR